jgi:hypothetical protein
MKDVMSHLSVGENVAECCHILPRRLRLERVQEYLAVLIQQGFPVSEQLSKINIYLRVSWTSSFFGDPRTMYYIG